MASVEVTSTLSGSLARGCGEVVVVASLLDSASADRIVFIVNFHAAGALPEGPGRISAPGPAVI
jgi:hypothetical protein